MAVYTSLDIQEIEAHLAQYALPALHKAEGIASGIENTNYLLTLKDNSKLILTLFEKRTKAEELPFFVSLMQKLAEKGIKAPLPIPAKNGENLLSLKGKSALIVSFLQGKGVTDITPHHLSELGNITAHMHQAVKNISLYRENSMGFSAWKAIYADIKDKILYAPFIEKILEEIATHSTQDLPSGIIHADLFPDNVFFDEAGQLSGVIDFYFACYDSFIYDLAICLNAWCFEPDVTFNKAKAKALFASYQAIRPLSEAEKQAFPLLAKAASLRFLLTRSYDQLFTPKDALVTPKNPQEYLQKLQFHHTLQHYSDYGMA